MQHKIKLNSIIYVFIITPIFLSSCSYVSSVGPSSRALENTVNRIDSNIQLIDVDASIIQRLQSTIRKDSFAHSLGTGSGAYIYKVGVGDQLEITIWEAPPAVLFGTSNNLATMTVSSNQASTFPPQIVASDGTIQLPFAGPIIAAGHTPEEIQTEIVTRLARKANKPQALVRVQKNESSTVSVVGEATQNMRVPLTGKGERILDAIAAAGGTKQPISKVTVQLTRSSKILQMPLENVVKEPAQNIQLVANDVITLLYQSKSFTVLGAAGKNSEIEFEEEGISLAQALARSGGIVSTQGDAYGVFIFRYESPNILPPPNHRITATKNNQVPVVYKFDMKDPASFLNAQNFPMRDKDVLYIAEAPVVGLQKFLGILSSSVYSITSINNLTK